MTKTLIQFVLLSAAVVGASFVSARLWADKPEGGGEMSPLVFEERMTVGQFAQRNELPGPLVQKVFDLQAAQDTQRLVTSFDMTSDEVLRKTEGPLAVIVLPGAKGVIPDCFACGTCIESCPTRAITFKTGRRPKPPQNKFNTNATKPENASA